MLLNRFIFLSHPDLTTIKDKIMSEFVTLQVKERGRK
jgi:hypothetical protein